MKRFFALLLTLTLCIGLFVGCKGAEQPADVKVPAAAGDKSNKAEDSKEETPKEEKKEKDTVPVRGVWNDDVYTNDFTGATFELPEGWLVASDEELAELIGASTDLLAESGLKFNEKMLEQQSIYDWMVQNPKTGTNVIGMFENLGLVIGGKNITEEEYFDSMKDLLVQANIADYTFGEITTETVSGAEYNVLEAAAPDAGLTQYYYINKQGSYMTAFIITIADGDSIEDVISHFK